MRVLTFELFGIAEALDSVIPNLKIELQPLGCTHLSLKELHFRGHVLHSLQIVSTTGLVGMFESDWKAQTPEGLKKPTATTWQLHSRSAVTPLPTAMSRILLHRQGQHTLFPRVLALLEHVHLS
jgi:hypothetical protein